MAQPNDDRPVPPAKELGSNHKSWPADSILRVLKFNDGQDRQISKQRFKNPYDLFSCVEG
jgi:hypothetical protein